MYFGYLDGAGGPHIDSPTSFSSSFLSAAVAAAVSVTVFWVGYRLNAAAAQRERQRKAIADWFRALSKWVDDFGDPSSVPEYYYNLLTSREIIELSLPRRHRFLAWWMHEMAVAVMTRRQEASKNLASRQSCSSDLNVLLRETGGGLLEWHHKKLKSSDFHFPYQLRVEARKTKMGVQEYAASQQLESYVTPARMTLRRQWVFQRLLFSPATGTPALDSLGPFVGPKYLGPALLYSGAARAGILLNLIYRNLNMISTKRKARHLKRKIRRLKRRMVKIRLHRLKRQQVKK